MLGPGTLSCSALKKRVCAPACRTRARAGVTGGFCRSPHEKSDIGARHGSWKGERTPAARGEPRSSGSSDAQKGPEMKTSVHVPRLVCLLGLLITSALAGSGCSAAEDGADSLSSEEPGAESEDSTGFALKPRLPKPTNSCSALGATCRDSRGNITFQDFGCSKTCPVGSAPGCVNARCNPQSNGAVIGTHSSCSCIGGSYLP